MRKRIRLAVLLIAALAVLVAGGRHLQWRLSPEGIASARLHDRFDTFATNFPAADIAPFPWTRVCVFGPYNGFGDDPIGWNDEGTWSVLFEGPAGERHWIKVSRRTIEYGGGDCRGRDAVFLVVRQDGRRSVQLAGE